MYHLKILAHDFIVYVLDDVHDREQLLLTFIQVHVCVKLIDLVDRVLECSSLGLGNQSLSLGRGESVLALGGEGEVRRVVELGRTGVEQELDAQGSHEVVDGPGAQGSVTRGREEGEGTTRVERETVDVCCVFSYGEKAGT